MSETPQEYTKRILGYLNGKEPLTILAATPARLAELTRGRLASEFGRQPAPGRWCVSEILAHLADVEMVIGYRVRMILSKPGTAIQAFDQDEWAKLSRYVSVPAAQSLERQRVQRESTVTLLKALLPEQWEHYGMHAERGKETVSRVVEMAAGHDINHLRQIEKILTV
jgi:DinB family protein